MASPYPENDSLFLDWINNFLTVANVNKVIIGISDPDLAALGALRTDLQNKITDDVSAKEAARAASAAKAASRKTINTQASFRVKSIASNPNIPASIKAQLGINIPDAPQASAPTVPGNLVAKADATGMTVLTWIKNGNRPNTQYIVEVKRSQNGGWGFVAVTTATKLSHTGQTPGRHQIYRVRAQRAGVQSAVSNEATVYADSAFPLEDNGIE